MSDHTHAIAEYIAQHPVFAPHVARPGYPWGTLYFPEAWPMPSAGELAEQMIEDAGFQALWLGGFLKTPDGALIARGVALVLPNPDRAVFSLALEALTLAAEKQNRLSPLQVGVGVVLAATFIAFLGRTGNAA